MCQVVDGFMIIESWIHCIREVNHAITFVSGLPKTGDHISKTVVLDIDHQLFVNIGSTSNACQVENRVAQSPGVFSSSELPLRADVWMFDSR